MSKIWLNRLGYSEDAQVMSIKENIPPVLVTQGINVTPFKEIRDTFTTLVKNPVMKRILMTDGDWVRRDWLPLTYPKCSGNLRMMQECVIRA